MTLSELQAHSVKSVGELQRQIRGLSLDAFLVSDLSNVRYLTLFSGTTALCVIYPDSSIFLTDFRYKEQAAIEVASCEIEIYDGNVIDYLAKKIFRGLRGRKLSIGIEDTISVGTLDELSSKVSSGEFTKTSQVIEKIASRKSKPELELIKQACSISGTALEILVQEEWTGKSETELAATLEFNQKVMGASKESFDTIVASGMRGAMPHGIASGRTIEKNELVTIDFGCFFGGYASDITRTFSTGPKIKSRLSKVYQIVLEAQRKAADFAKAGVAAKSVDRAARSYIERKGYAKYFGHGTGHGVGLRIHELPRVSRTSDDVLEEGNVITIEPGIYLPGIGGVRIEDDFVVTQNGVEQLTHFSKEMEYYITTYGK